MGKRSRSKRESSLKPPRHTEPVLAPQSSALAWWLSAAIVLLTLALYAQVATHRFINFDDPNYVTANDHVLTGLTWSNIVWAFTHVHASYWHPLTWISHMLDVQLFGLDAGKHLLVNVVLHVANTILLLFTLRRLTGNTWRSAVVAALFALHPLHVESVAWVAERKDVLSTLFFFLAIFFYAGGRRWLTLLAFICGVMAKPMVITLPFVLLLLDWWPLQRWSPREWSKLKAPLIEKWPLFLVIPIVALVTLFTQHEAMATTPIAVPLRLANATVSYVAYLVKALVPVKLAVFYPFPTVVSPAAALLSLALLIAITIAVLRFIDAYPFLAVGWFWYLGTLVPVIGIVQVGQQAMADRFTYVPLIGIFFAAVWFCADRIPRPAVSAAIVAVFVAAYAVLTSIQLRYWRDSITLFTHAIEVEPRGRISHIDLGAAYLETFDDAGAAAQFREAIALFDGDDLAHNGLGMTYAATGDTENARREFERAIQLNPANPGLYRNLGRLELGAGHPERAIPLLEKSLAMQPDDDETIAALDSARGDVDGAIAAYRRLIDRHTGTPDWHNDLGALLARKGDDRGALDQYEAALRLAPDSYDAHMNAGALLARDGRENDAMSHFDAAAKTRPKSPEPHVYLALLYGNANRFADAVKEVRAAAAIDPEAANAQFSNAVHIEAKPTNLAEYLGALQRKATGG